jgi:hypothetical protein
MKYNYGMPSFVDYNTMQSHFDKSMHLETTTHDLKTCKSHQLKEMKLNYGVINKVEKEKKNLEKFEINQRRLNNIKINYRINNGKVEIKSMWHNRVKKENF